MNQREDSAEVDRKRYFEGSLLFADADAKRFLSRAFSRFFADQIAMLLAEIRKGNRSIFWPLVTDVIFLIVSNVRRMIDVDDYSSTLLYFFYSLAHKYSDCSE